MKKAFASGDCRSLFQLIRSTGSRKPNVSDVIKEKVGTTVYSQKRRLERWAEHFSEQFNWPQSQEYIQMETEPSWNVDLSPPSVQEVRHEIQRLKENKEPGPDGLHSLLFKKVVMLSSTI